MIISFDISQYKGRDKDKLFIGSVPVTEITLSTPY